MKFNKKMLGMIIGILLIFSVIVTLTLRPHSEENNPYSLTTTHQVGDEKNSQKSSTNKSESNETEKNEKNTTSTKVTKEENNSKKLENEKKVDIKDTSENKNTDNISVNEESKKPIQEEINTPTQKEENKEETEKHAPPVDNNQYITMSIDCKTILNNMSKLPEQYIKYVPSNGMIMSPKKIKIQEGDTVFDIVMDTAKKQNIQISQKSGYIQSIHNLPEKLFDGSGGWMYSVNGDYANVGCKEYKLKNGDYVQWRYSCFIGDLN